MSEQIERICIMCKHWYFNCGTPDLSDVTPGDNADTGCWKNHWEISLYSVDTEEYRAKILSARTCPDFTPIEMRGDSPNSSPEQP